MKKYIFKHLSS